MLPAGYVLCPRCGKATPEAYYYNSTDNLWVQLKRSLTGRCFVEGYTPAYMAEETEEELSQPGDFVLVSSVSFPKKQSEKDLMQHTIQVSYRQGVRTKTATFSRSCPFCVGQPEENQDNTVQETIYGLGVLPTYVIGVVGARSVGKSCLIHALSCSHNLNRVNDGKTGHGYNGYALQTPELAEGKTDRPAATPVGDLGNTRIVKIIRKKSHGKSVAVAQILILDVAGEVFARGQAEAYRDKAAPLFVGADAFIFMLSPADIPSLNENTQYTPEHTYNRLNERMGIQQGKPFAFVLNKVDKLFDHPPTAQIQVAGHTEELPLFTRQTFSQTEDMYRKSQLLPRIALENMLLRRLIPLVETAALETRCSGFLVKTTTPLSETLLNFTDSVNVMDPLLWILNELDIFPIE